MQSGHDYNAIGARLQKGWYGDGYKMHIATFTVDNDGKVSLFDEFDVINDSKDETGINSANSNNDVTIKTDKNREVTISGITPDSVEVYTTNGAKVKEYTGASRLSLADLPAGIYLV